MLYKILYITFFLYYKSSKTKYMTLSKRNLKVFESKNKIEFLLKYRIYINY